MTVLDRDMNLELVRLQSRASLQTSRHDPWKEPKAALVALGDPTLGTNVSKRAAWIAIVGLALAPCSAVQQTPSSRSRRTGDRRLTLYPNWPAGRPAARRATSQKLVRSPSRADRLGGP